MIKNIDEMASAKELRVPIRTASFNIFFDRCNYETNRRASLAAMEILGQSTSLTPQLGEDWLAEMAEWSIPKSEKQQI